MKPNLPGYLVNKRNNRHVLNPLRTAKGLSINLVYHEIKITLSFSPPKAARLSVYSESSTSTNNPITTLTDFVIGLVLYRAGKKGYLVAFIDPNTSDSIGIDFRTSCFWMG
jgi:hypothetical protein